VSDRTECGRCHVGTVMWETVTIGWKTVDLCRDCHGIFEVYWRKGQAIPPIVWDRPEVYRSILDLYRWPNGPEPEQKEEDVAEPRKGWFRRILGSLR
jgi:hypothetical protein